MSPVRASASTIATDTRSPSLLRGFLGDGFEAGLHRICWIVSWWRVSLGAARSASSERWAASDGQGGAAGRNIVDRGASGLAFAEQPGLDHARQHAVACGLRIVAKTIRTAAFRQLRQCHQQRRFRDRKALRLLAEIGKRGGAHAFEIAAIGRQRQVALEDFALGDAALDLPGAEDLGDLRRNAAAFARLDQAGKLHRQRRAARDDAAIAGELAGGAQQCQRIDTGMIPEALVLIGDEHPDEFRIDLVERDAEPPIAVARGVGAQQRAVAVDDLLRDWDFLQQRRREGVVERVERGDGESRDGGGADRDAFEVFAERQHGRAPLSKVRALRCPPLSCRTSPPHGGRLAVARCRAPPATLAIESCERRCVHLPPWGEMSGRTEGGDV